MYDAGGLRYQYTVALPACFLMPWRCTTKLNHAVLKDFKEARQADYL